MITLPPLDNNVVVIRVDPGDIHVTGDINNGCLVFLESTGGNITIDGNINGGCRLTLKAARNVFIGASSDSGTINGSSQLQAVAGGSIAMGNSNGSCTVDLSAHGDITVRGDLNGSSTARYIADGDVTITGKIDGSSRADLVSNHGSVLIEGKVDGSSKVWLTAAGAVRIGTTGGDDDRKIAGDSFVSATSGGFIELGTYISNGNTVVDFMACGNVTVGKDISGGATVRLLSATGTIAVSGIITDSGTSVQSFPALTNPNVQNGASAVTKEWASPDPLCLAEQQNGSWWENWSQTFGYVVPERVVPRSLEELVAVVVGAGTPDMPDTTPVKAVGGGWSFTDASLPIVQSSDVNRISLLLKGRPAQQDLHDVLDGLSDVAAVPMDLLPGAVMRNVAFSTAYDQQSLRQITTSGAQLPSLATKARLIDTRGLASSLQCEFPNIRASIPGTVGVVPRPDLLFHVEAGITMADLQQLLDHQFPRLALRATGGSPGATLAGTLSTATHGGEFKWTLLVDSVRAIHLVGPGGEQWWIEGDEPVADPVKLQQRYPKIDAAHFIGGAWSGIPGLNAQDVLNAVTVSMGTMGVIYSVVFEVVPQFGMRQIVHPTTWSDLLTTAGITEDQLRANDSVANTTLLKTLLNGSANGTGIPFPDNVYADLAINPINKDCWILNRHPTPHIPIDANASPAAMNDYLTALGLALAQHDDFLGDKLMGRHIRLFAVAHRSRRFHYASDYPRRPAETLVVHHALARRASRSCRARRRSDDGQHGQRSGQSGARARLLRRPAQRLLSRARRDATRHQLRRHRGLHQAGCNRLARHRRTGARVRGRSRRD